MHIETQTEWEVRMFRKVLDYLKGELCIDFPYMERALAALESEGKENLYAFATEGIHIYFPPEHYLKLFEENELFLKRAYLHVVLHCLYAHLWLQGRREKELWNISCDIAVEYIIDRFNKRSTKRLLSWSRQQFYQKMDEEKQISAAGIYEILKNQPKEYVNQLAAEFYTDDHSLWQGQKAKNPTPNEQKQQDDARQNWQKLARQTQFQKEKNDKPQEAAQTAMQEKISADRRHRSYKDFLQKFAAYREEMRVDLDEFDLNYYTYGLRIYGNMPLIEPLETKEERRIQEFVVAVDTSYSTSGDLVRSFLKETLHILLEENAFFSTACVHLIQCDDRVQEDIEISSIEQAKQVLSNYEIKGGGNTDFRPVFTYVNQMRDEGKLHNLGGLLYFTDGNGIYPVKKPDYKCAFLFLNKYKEEDVPVWAIRLKLEGSVIK